MSIHVGSTGPQLPLNNINTIKYDIKKYKFVCNAMLETIKSLLKGSKTLIRSQNYLSLRLKKKVPRAFPKQSHPFISTKN